MVCIQPLWLLFLFSVLKSCTHNFSFASFPTILVLSHIGANIDGCFGAHKIKPLSLALNGFWWITSYYKYIICSTLKSIIPMVKILSVLFIAAELHYKCNLKCKLTATATATVLFSSFLLLLLLKTFSDQRCTYSLTGDGCYYQFFLKWFALILNSEHIEISTIATCSGVPFIDWIFKVHSNAQFNTIGTQHKTLYTQRKCNIRFKKNWMHCTRLQYIVSNCLFNMPLILNFSKKNPWNMKDGKKYSAGNQFCHS